jgi:hypothetical protein
MSFIKLRARKLAASISQREEIPVACTLLGCFSFVHQRKNNVLKLASYSIYIIGLNWCVSTNIHYSVDSVYRAHDYGKLYFSVYFVSSTFVKCCYNYNSYTEIWEAVERGMNPDSIKKTVSQWRADHLRV